MRLLVIFGALVHAVFGGVGPQPLYQSLVQKVYYLNSPGSGFYEIKPYAEVKHIDVQNISYGRFQTYSTFNSEYVNQEYSGGSTAGGCTPRSIQLAIDCGQSASLGPINEGQPCEYSGILFVPEACGVDFSVGNEFASVSATITPSVSPISSGTQSVTPTATSSAIFFATMFPSATQTMTMTPSATPLFMITSWPTTSPQNVSPSSTPLYFLTPYPSYGAANGTGIVGLIFGSVPSNIATILGGVAVGGLGLAAIIYTIIHFRRGGTVSGLLTKYQANSGLINKFVKELPVSDSLKNAITDPTSVMSPQAKRMLELGNSPELLLKDLPISEDMKKQLNTSITSAKTKALNTSFVKKPVVQTVTDLDDGPALEEEVENTNIVIDSGTIIKPKSLKIVKNLSETTEKLNNSVNLELKITDVEEVIKGRNNVEID